MLKLYILITNLNFNLMVSISETGYVKLKSNLGVIISTAEGIGTKFNPTDDRIKLPALKAAELNASGAIDNVRALYPAYSSAVNARETAFAPLGKLVTRITSALKACGASIKDCESVMTLARKFKGTRATPKLTEEEKKTAAEQGTEIVQASSSQMSYDNRLDFLNGIIKILQGNEKYAPNEADLKTENLRKLYEDLVKLNDAVIAANTPLYLARVKRNQILFNPETGIVVLGMLAKAYIRSIYGTTDPVYRRISSLAFTNKKGI